MTTQTVPRLRLRGSAYEIGRQHGAEFASRIQDNIKIYFNIFAHYAEPDADTVFSRAQTFIPIIENFDRELMDEIRGIARVTLSPRTLLRAESGSFSASFSSSSR